MKTIKLAKNAAGHMGWFVTSDGFVTDGHVMFPAELIKGTDQMKEKTIEAKKALPQGPTDLELRSTAALLDYDGAYSRIFRTHDGTPIGFNDTYYYIFRKFESDKTPLQFLTYDEQNPQHSCCAVYAGDTFVGVIMPMRLSFDHDVATLDWGKVR